MVKGLEVELRLKGGGNRRFGIWGNTGLDGVLEGCALWCSNLLHLECSRSSLVEDPDGMK